MRKAAVSANGDDDERVSQAQHDKIGSDSLYEPYLKAISKEDIADFRGCKVDGSHGLWNELVVRGSSLHGKQLCQGSSK